MEVAEFFLKLKYIYSRVHLIDSRKENRLFWVQKEGNKTVEDNDICLNFQC